MNFIGKDLKELMPLAYRNEQFLEQLLSEHFENIHSKEAIHEIVLELIEIIIRKDERKYISEKLLDASFKYISDARTSTVTYNRFVEILSSLQIRFNDERIKKKLVTTILHDNTTQALAAIDIWCTIFMLSDSSIKQSYLKFWININERFAQFSTNMPALHTELLLKNFYKLLSPQEKTDVWTKFTACTLRNDRLFLTIGLDAIPICPAKQSIIQHFQNELFGLLKETGKEKTIQGYYTIVIISCSFLWINVTSNLLFVFR
ncbi:uncharacterized protein LOC129910941 [Episyrphus balteatus]|uniref:uncharacterized protein LOC129910941 n=1 Tax=Episyrphus balteatus TaxID=286459 RepID=UPI00248528D7|nr:uncharacterized protein LOC129910941 [Episyrphus balteatus]